MRYTLWNRFCCFWLGHRWGRWQRSHFPLELERYCLRCDLTQYHNTDHSPPIHQESK